MSRKSKRHDARLDRRFARQDTDGDGVITRKESDARFDKRFSRLDANGDGNITKEEMSAARKRFHGRRGHGMRRGHK